MGKNKRKRDFGTKEIVFDPDARKSYLQGFSERKRQRRAYGLAMQKVKDRKAKIEQRAEVKKAVEEQIEEAEQQKAEILSGVMGGTKTKELIRVSKADKATESSADGDVQKVQTYQDAITQSHWGGSVTVTTTTVFPDEDSDREDGPTRNNSKKKVDVEQEYAGDVQRFMDKLKGRLPGKKKNENRTKHNGNHGAAGMKGMAGSKDLKIAQKALARSEAKKGRQGQARKGKKRRGS